MKNLTTPFSFITRALPVAGLLAAVFASEVCAKDPAPNLATKAALHPGTEAAHESFNEISKAGDAPLVFLGDSITAGWRGRGKVIWDEFWAPMHAANFGIGGDRTEHILWRLEHGNYDGLKPKLTVLMIGTNNTGHEGRAMAEHGGQVYSNTPEQTAEGVAAIIDLLHKKQPQMKVLILGIFPRGVDKSDAKRQKNEVINGLVAKLADDKSVFYMDINNAFLEPDGSLSKDIMPDLLHPNEIGYRIWAEAIQKRVKELMAG